MAVPRTRFHQKGGKLLQVEGLASHRSDQAASRIDVARSFVRNAANNRSPNAEVASARDNLFDPESTCPLAQRPRFGNLSAY
jgi:hypothetical protein